jgi:hypothetical protein
MNDAHNIAAVPEQYLRPQQRCEDEQAMHLELGQLVTETSRPLPRAALSVRAAAGLWVLRIFAVVVSLMVIYAFVSQLR